MLIVRSILFVTVSFGPNSVKRAFVVARVDARTLQANRRDAIPAYYNDGARRRKGKEKRANVFLIRFIKRLKIACASFARLAQFILERLDYLSEQQPARLQGDHSGETCSATIVEWIPPRGVNSAVNFI